LGVDACLGCKCRRFGCVFVVVVVTFIVVVVVPVAAAAEAAEVQF
jgi:hypothetical protein